MQILLGWKDNNMDIIFDLDGTLIDSSDRMYILFKKLIPECTFTKKKYWELKRNGESHCEIINKYFPCRSFEEFEPLWLDMIEKENYLKLDKNYQDTIGILKYYSRCRTILLTARQSRDLLFVELARLEIDGFFDEVFVTGGTKTKDEILCDAIKRGEIKNPSEDYFISDMGKDIVLGNNMGFRTVAITHGFMSKKELQKYNPLFFVDNLLDLKDIINIE